MVPAINLRRVYLIARRDYLGYIKTWGFWISFFIPFIFGAIGVFAASLDFELSPPRYETVFDETGEFESDFLSFQRNLTGGPLAEVEIDGGPIQGMIDNEVEKASATGKVIFIPAPAQDLETLKSYVKNGTIFSYDGADIKLSGLLHISKNSDLSSDSSARSDDGSQSLAEKGRPVKTNPTFRVDYWSPNFTGNAVPDTVSRFFKQRAIKAYLETGKLSLEGFEAINNGKASINTYDPTKVLGANVESQAITAKDRIPYVVAVILSGVLWLIVFSGSYMLLTSMLEEKLNKLMEMMLASTRFSEIIFGKLLGVAAMTVTAMLPYILIGVASVIGIIFMGPSEWAMGLAAAFTPKLIIFFSIFLVLGYLFYGSFFIALGALSESMQDAQTLTTPIMLVLTACILVVPLGLENPDSPLLVYASWFPLSAPFASIIRLPSDPPLWELCLSAFFLFLVTLGVIFMCGRIFRYGILSGSGLAGVRQWIGRTIFRRKDKA